MSRLKTSLPESLAATVKTTIADWQSRGNMQRLWKRDATLWTGSDEGQWLGWLDIVDEQLTQQDQLQKIAKEVQQREFQHVLLLGMGGSSLCPEVLRMTFGRIAHFPTLHVLDSTDPGQVKAFEHQIDIPKTLFIVSSKSGSTLEPNIFKQYFFERTKQAVGVAKVGSHFMAITDPGSKMQQVAEGDHFLHVFFGRPSIGGRYSALSNFGMVPAAVMGLDTKKFLARAAEMVRGCGAGIAVEENSAAVLGIILGTAANTGRDKVTIITSPSISDLGAWLEQLLAESTGKVGKGIIPVDREHLTSPDVYGNDRVFVYVRLESGPDADQDAKVAAIEKAGHPVVRISMADVYDLGAEFFRWEIATAVAGATIGINAFNQPDVEASKVVTRDLTSAYEKTGALPAEKPVVEDAGIKIFTDEKNAADLATAAGGNKTVAGYLKAHLSRIKTGDYFAVLGYIQMNAENEQSLQNLRHLVRDKKHVATCLGFGPRFLHSTGQAYKGGPNSGVFLQITCDDSVELPVPGQKYTFGVVKAAQARGDFQVLADRGRRALRVHLGSNLKAGLTTLQAAVQKAL
ncbi:MAG TPA: bifunctional transaldolase/phosoglucose isomerase [Candidatus Sulfotelmatobacter sp.]|nr:bifunctional transaldolase/phosoglucose isomerase [Candidatus Sulfotelmatobacter sp.]